MSVTLQKELLESDDVVQSSNSVIRTLESAKKINKDAYSGYFAKSRAGEHARRLLKDFEGTLVTDDYSGSKALFA